MFDATPSPQKKPFGGHQVNLAPLEPLQKQGEPVANRESSYLFGFIRDLHNHIIGEHVTERREIAEQGRLMANLRSGKLRRP